MIHFIGLVHTHDEQKLQFMHLEVTYRRPCDLELSEGMGLGGLVALKCPTPQGQ